MNISQPEERLPVWDALAQFFLDDELQPGDYERIANVLADSRYSLAELEDILRHEVYPACKWNLICVAGAWGTWGEEWIMEHIAPRKDRRPRFSLPPLLASGYRNHWKAVSEIIVRRRRGESESADSVPDGVP
jgi:hypothetical protein